MIPTQLYHIMLNCLDYSYVSTMGLYTILLWLFVFNQSDAADGGCCLSFYIMILNCNINQPDISVRVTMSGLS